jgi:acetyl-CoA carboxylase biotin carboxyl carrier protein
MTEPAGVDPAPDAAVVPPVEVAALIALVDQLEELLVRSALDELEVEAGGTALILRTPAALRAQAVATVSVDPAPVAHPRDAGARGEPDARVEPTVASGYRAVLAPLTGLFYASPSPGAEAYVREGSQVVAGQVIGLIEAMKLFNEIKSDVTGIVRRVAVENGALVKARQPLIEVEST